MASTYRPLANTCDNGPCPTLHVNPDTGGVLVQGYVTSDTPSQPVPAGEDVVSIPADAWAKLLADLPLSMLLRALVAPWRFRSRNTPVVAETR